MSETPKYQNKELRNSILLLLDYFKELFRKWYVHLFFVLLFCGFTYFHLSKKVPKYEARLTFMSNTGGGGKVSSLMRMASSFGLNMGGGSSSALSAEKLSELLVSNRMMKTTLLKNVELEGKNDLLINHFERIFKENPSVISLAVEDENNIDLNMLNIKENGVLRDAIEKIKKLGLAISTSDNGIVRVSFETESEAFTQKFITILVENLSEFYTSKTVEQQQETNDMLSFRVDSLNNLLLSKEAALREWLGKYTLRLGAGSLTPDEFLTKSRLEREAEITSNVYKEAVQAFEIAKMDLDASKPIIQIIDYPVLPLKEKVPVPWVFYAVATIGALLVSSVLILFVKLIRDALNYENSED